MRPSTEEPGFGNLGQEIESLPGTDIEEGETERGVSLLDKEKEPKRNASEWNRLKTCERPCAKEDWRSMTIQNKWKTMENLGLLWNAEEKEVEGDQSIPGPPKSANAPPPPRPPSTFLRDMPRLGNKLGSIDEGSIAVGWKKKKEKNKRGQKENRTQKEKAKRIQKEKGKTKKGRRGSRRTQPSVIRIKLHMEKTGA